MSDIPIQEYEYIVEYCFHPKHEHFIVRFLDGSSYILAVEDLPKKLQTKKPQWEEATLSEDHRSLLVQAKQDVREIPSHLIHSKGKTV